MLLATKHTIPTAFFPVVVGYTPDTDTMPPRLTALMQASSTLGEPFSKLITAFALSRNDLSGSNPALQCKHRLSDLWRTRFQVQKLPDKHNSPFPINFPAKAFSSDLINKHICALFFAFISSIPTLPWVSCVKNTFIPSVING